MNRLHDLLPRIIEDLDEEYPVGVIGLDDWGYITMGPDIDLAYHTPVMPMSSTMWPTMSASATLR